MTNLSERPKHQRPRDAEYRAPPVSRLRAPDVPPDATKLNVEGRRVHSPLQGFGRMWQKTYWIRLGGVDVTPTEVLKAWKENFSRFWPRGNRYYGPLTGIAPGEVAVLNPSTPGGMTLSTGVMVIYADDESLTFMTPEGHVFSGWITFSAFEQEGRTVAQAQVLIRPNDPLYEISFRLGGSRAEDTFWIHTLESLASYFGVKGRAQMSAPVWTRNCNGPRPRTSGAILP